MDMFKRQMTPKDVDDSLQKERILDCTQQEATGSAPKKFINLHRTVWQAWPK